MRSLTSSRPAWSASSTSRVLTGSSLLVGALGPRHGDQPVEVGADHLRLAAALARALQPARARARPARARPRACRLPRSSSGTRRRRRRRPRRAPCGSTPSACAGSTRAAASGRRTRRRRGSCGAPAAGQALALHLEGELEALADVERLEQLDLLLEGQVGGVAAGVGQGARLGDRAQERRDAAVVAAQLEDLLDHGAVLALEVAGPAVDGHRRPGARRPRRAGGRRRRPAPRRATPRATPSSWAPRPPPGRRTRSATLGDGADGGELALVAGDEDDALLPAGVDREGHVHRREDDGVFEGDEEETGQEQPLRS